MKTRGLQIATVILLVCFTGHPVKASTGHPVKAFTENPVKTLPGTYQKSGDLVCADPVSGDPVRDEIAKVNKLYGEAYEKGDSTLFLQCYTQDACIMAANTPILCEQSGLLLFYNAGRRMGVRNIVFTTIQLYGITNEYATEQGIYEMFDAGQKSLGKGKYLVLWKKTDEGWKMYRDMFNSDGAPKAALK